jgi:ApaG protein
MGEPFFMYVEVTRQIEIRVEPLYVANQSRPEESYYFFAYKVHLKNLGTVPVQLLSRHWTITDGHGHVEEVKGPGVVGQQPRLEAQQTYEYTSFCPLPTPTGNMRGTYTMTTDTGEHFNVEIPVFFFRIPELMH